MIKIREEEIKKGIIKIKEGEKKMKDLEKRINRHKKFQYKKALYVAIGAAAVGIITFIVLKNKK